MNIQIREVDDWIAVYRDGRKVYEGHSATPEMLLDALGIEHQRRYFESGDYDPDTATLPDGSDLFPEEL
jgi:hypothetical protein